MVVYRYSVLMHPKHVFHSKRLTIRPYYITCSSLPRGQRYRIKIRRYNNYLGHRVSELFCILLFSKELWINSTFMCIEILNHRLLDRYGLITERMCACAAYHRRPRKCIEGIGKINENDTFLSRESQPNTRS